MGSLSCCLSHFEIGFLVAQASLEYHVAEDNHDLLSFVLTAGGITSVCYHSACVLESLML